MGDNAIIAPQGKKGLNAFVLKNIAIVAMFLDHLAFIVAPTYFPPLATAMHFIGRITGPVMFYMLAEGYNYTRDKNKYMFRLFIGAVISYLPFIYYFHEELPNANNFLDLNVMYTLLVAFIALRFRHEAKNKLVKILGIAACVLLASYGDWHYYAVIFVLLFDYFRGSFKKQALAYSVVVFVSEIIPRAAALVTEIVGYNREEWVQMNAAYLFVQCGMLLPIFLLSFYNGKAGKNTPLSKWLFYAFYPLHLVLLIIIKWLVQ